MYESDYILRMVAQLGGLLRRAVAALKTDPAEALEHAEEAVRAAADAGLPVVDAFSAEGLAAYLGAGGQFDTARAVALSRALAARANALAATGEAARAATEQARADALLRTARTTDPDGTARFLDTLERAQADGGPAAEARS